jgi:hypothetical protein
VRPEPALGPFTWCHDCGWQLGELRYVEVLEYSEEPYTPIEDVDTIQVSRTPCGCDPDDYDDDDFEDDPSMGKTIQRAWRCGHCKAVQEDFADADHCCPNIVIVPAGHKITFENGQTYRAVNQPLPLMKESNVYEISIT